jgi:dihydropteroate synthase
VDTVKAQVADPALASGARIINDISCGRNERLLSVVAERGADLVLMHNRGRGEVEGDNVRYADVVTDVLSELLAAVDRAVSLGVERERIWLDPGIGFAKTARQSLELVANVDRLASTGHRVLVGTSRKSFIANIVPNADASVPTTDQREGGTAATVAFAALGGVHAVRVHDVALMRQTLRMTEALRGSVQVHPPAHGGGA